MVTGVQLRPQSINFSFFIIFQKEKFPAHLMSVTQFPAKWNKTLKISEDGAGTRSGEKIR